jgi:hypothetical protein
MNLGNSAVVVAKVAKPAAKYVAPIVKTAVKVAAVPAKVAMQVSKPAAQYVARKTVEQATVVVKDVILNPELSVKQKVVKLAPPVATAIASWQIASFYLMIIVGPFLLAARLVPALLIVYSLWRLFEKPLTKIFAAFFPEPRQEENEAEKKVEDIFEQMMPQDAYYEIKPIDVGPQDEFVQDDPQNLLLGGQ